MFLPQYCPKAKGWYVCRVLTPASVSNVILCPNRENCLKICAALNRLQSDLHQLVTSALSTTYKSDSPTASDSCRKSQSKIF